MRIEIATVRGVGYRSDTREAADHQAIVGVTALDPAGARHPAGDRRASIDPQLRGGGAAGHRGTHPRPRSMSPSTSAQLDAVTASPMRRRRSACTTHDGRCLGEARQRRRSRQRGRSAATRHRRTTGRDHGGLRRSTTNHGERRRRAPPHRVACGRQPQVTYGLAGDGGHGTRRPRGRVDVRQPGGPAPVAPDHRPRRAPRHASGPSEPCRASSHRASPRSTRWRTHSRQGRNE